MAISPNTIRDPNRIDAMLELIRKLWTQSPDLRLGQIVVGAVAPQEPCPEVFYIEDTELYSRLERYYQRVTAAQQQRK